MQKIPILRTTAELKNLNSLKKHSTSISKDWFGNQLDKPVHFTLVRDPSSLHFYFKSNIPTNNQTLDILGEFKKDLWKKDVTEIFISNPSNNTYQEFNISPDGAWWSGLFSAYRVQDMGFQAEKPLLVKAHREQESWEIFFSYPIKNLGFTKKEDDPLLINVSSLHYKKDCTFISWSTTDTEPDYHNRDIFCKPEYLCLESEKKKN